MKLFITGPAAGGKSTLGKRLAGELGLPFYTLDKIVWQSGWKKTPDAEKQARIAELIDRPSWVIDGVSFDVQKAADVVIFLDVSRRISFWRASKRSLCHLFSSRPDVPPHSPEFLIIPTLIKVIWRFPKHIRPYILAEQAIRPPHSFIRIRHAGELTPDRLAKAGIAISHVRA